MSAVLAHIIAALRQPAPPDPVGMVQDRLYTLGSYPDDGETFRLEGSRLVNLTRPGYDLFVRGAAVRDGDGRFVERVSDLRPGPGWYPMRG
jgi:hypothetical protein